MWIRKKVARLLLAEARAARGRDWAITLARRVCQLEKEHGFVVSEEEEPTAVSLRDRTNADGDVYDETGALAFRYRAANARSG